MTTGFLQRLAAWPWLAALLMCLALAAGPARAAASGVPPLTLTGTAPSHELSGHLSLLRDPTGRLTIDDVRRAAPRSMAKLPGPVSLGFTRDVVWLRFVVERPNEQAPDHWWLALSHPLMQDVRLYGVLGDESGGPDPGALRPAVEIADALNDRRPVFELAMHATGPRTYYLRLESQASMALTATLWQPAAMAGVQNRASFYWGGLFGAYALVILFYLAFWVWTREQLHIVYVLYVLVNFLAALFTDGWPHQLWPALDPDTNLLLLGMWILSSLVVGSWFSVMLLELHRRWPGYIRGGLFVLAAGVALAMVGVAQGHYQTVIPVAQALSIALIASFFFMGIYLALSGQRAAFLFLGAFSFFYLGVAVRYLRNIGLLEPSFWTDNSYQIGAFVHMLVMSIGIFSRYRILRRQTEEAQARVAAEMSLRTQQRDFMTMVSHEFRTPLSIIDATTHNLLQEPQLPAAARERVLKVVRANDRMSSLMENYLASERVLDQADSSQEARDLFEAHDLLEICRAVCKDQEDAGGPPPVLKGPAGVQVMGDEHLLRIALSNLVTNARRHSPPGVAVEVEVMADEQQARACVRDGGPGIPADEAGHIFNRFFRGRAARLSHGTGLGLYLVQVIAQRHGGSIATRNLTPRGCEFTFSLPRAPAAS